MSGDDMVVALAATGESGVETAVVLEAAFRARYQALVGVARLLVDGRCEAEELVQEAFARVYARGPAFATTDEAVRYVQRVVVNLCHDTLRRRRVVRRLRPVESTAEPGADRGVLLSEDQRLVTDAVRALPRRQREVVVLRHLLDLSTAETAVALGIAEGSVKSHLSRAMTVLADRLEGSR